MMSNVTYKKLGEVASYINGYAFKPETWSEKGVPIIRIQNLNNSEAAYNCYEGELPAKFIIEKGDLLVSWSASLGTYFWQGEKAYLNQHIFKVVFDKSDIDKSYLKYVVDAKLEEMKRKVHGATMQHIVKKDFDDTLIPVPSLEYQQRIVSELDVIHAIITAKNEQLRELDKLAEAIFYDMFGDPIANEKGWEIKKLGEVCDVRDGTHDSPHYLKHSNYLLITSKNIVDGKIDFSTATNYISKEDFDAINKRSKVDVGDIIMPMIGTIGNPIIVEETEQKYCIKNVALIKFGGNKEVVNVYVKMLISSPSYMQYMLGLNKGGTQKFIALGTIRQLFLPLPPLDLQQAFASKISAIEQQKERIRLSLCETEALLAARMQHYFD